MQTGLNRDSATDWSHDSAAADRAATAEGRFNLHRACCKLAPSSPSEDAAPNAGLLQATDW